MIQRCYINLSTEATRSQSSKANKLESDPLAVAIEHRLGDVVTQILDSIVPYAHLVT
jgi:hypothetical protein